MARVCPAARVRACLLLVYASMPVVPNPPSRAPRGNVLVFKDEGIDEVFAELLPAGLLLCLNERPGACLLAVVLHVEGWLFEDRIRTGSKEITF